ncbi:O-unit flippase-like protein [Caldifermentibacillus hisashii]|uniref:O-unit flippase-like protein n=1 Tax=Caldifermentibacillus hisashii TaxID=996558 RepID=UPI0031FBDD53
MSITLTKKDIVWNYIGTFISLISNFLLLPFMIIFLNGKELGLWYVYLSIGAIVTLFDFGFAPTLSRNIAYSWSGANRLKKTGVEYSTHSEPNYILLKKVLITCRWIYFLIAFTALLIIISFGTFYIKNISNELNNNEILYSWLIYCLAVFLNLLYGYYISLLRGIGAIYKYNIANTIAKIFQIIISIILLASGLGLVGASLGYLSYGVLFRTLSKKFFFNHNNIGYKLKNIEYRVSFKDIKENFRIVWFNAWRDGVVSLSNYFSTQATTIICSNYLSLEETGIYSLSLQIVTSIASISGALYGAYQPSLQAAYVNRDLNESKKIMSIVMSVYCTLYLAGVLLFITIGIPILEWLSSDLVLNIPVLLLLSLYMFLSKHHSYYASYISNTNKVPYVKAFIASSICGVILSTILIGIVGLGVWGLILGQLFVQLLYNNWKWPYVVMKKLDTNPLKMFKVFILATRSKLIKKSELI